MLRMTGTQPHFPMRFHNLNEEIFIFVFPFRMTEMHARALSVLGYAIMYFCTQYQNLEGIGSIFHPNVRRRQFSPTCWYLFTNAHSMSQNTLIRIYLIQTSAQWPSVVNAVTNNPVA